MSEATPYAPVTLDAIGEATDPLDLRTVSVGVTITCHAVGTVTFVLETSDDERSTRAYDVIATYTATAVKSLYAPMPRFLRVRITSGTGSVAVSTGMALNADGTLCSVNYLSENS